MDVAIKRESFGVKDTQVQPQALTEEEVIHEYRHFVEAQASKLHRQLRLRVEREDLIAYGMVGLLQAWRRYDPSSAAAFTSFAFHRVRGAMIDGCRKEGWAPRERKATKPKAIAAANDYMEAQREANQSLPASGSLTESIERVASTVGDVLTIFFLEHSELAQLDVTEDSPQHEALAREDVQKRLLAAIAQLDESEQRVIKRHHFYEDSLTEIAQTLGVSTSWCSRIHARALKKLRDVLLTQDADTFGDLDTR